MNLFEQIKANSISSSSKRKYTVYKGFLNGQLVYIGTTIQKPEDRFRWHRNNGKNLRFEIIQQFDNPEEMLNLEFKLIQELKPKYNNITHRKQNLNRKLTSEEIESRKGKKEWCQKCLRRHVNSGYKYCRYCS
jgi:hypothetical protein